MQVTGSNSRGIEITGQKEKAGKQESASIAFAFNSPGPATVSSTFESM
jgi:hypothetical protein